MTTATLYPKLSDTDAVIDACSQRPDVAPFARIVGRWVWAEFPTKPEPDTLAFLKATGFRWNPERMAWQHACGIFTRRNRRIDPRAVYGEREIDTKATYCTREQAGTRSSIDRDLSTFQSM